MKTELMWVVSESAGAAAAAQGSKMRAGGHTLKFITASKTKTPAAPVVLPQQTAGEVAEAAGVPVDASTGVPPTVSVGPVAAAGGVTALLDEATSVQSVAQLPVPLVIMNMVCSMNNNATVKLEEVLDANGKVKGKEEVMVGDATEVALLRASQQAYAGVSYWEQTFGLKRVLEFAFDSDRKRMSVVLSLPAAGDSQEFAGVQRPAGVTHVLLSKGAPEAVLNRSVAHLSQEVAGAPHVVTKLTDAVESRIEEEGSFMASQGMRVLATAMRFLTQAQVDKFIADQQAANVEAEANAGKKPVDGEVAAPSIGDLSCQSAESELVFIGLAGIMDPPRVEVADAIQRAHTAGIRVVMITGTLLPV